MLRDAKVCLVFTKTDGVPGVNFDLLKYRIVAAINNSATVVKVMGEKYKSKSVPEIQFLAGYFACSAKTGQGIDEIFGVLQKALFGPRDALEENTQKISLAWKSVGKPTPKSYSPPLRSVGATPPPS